MDPEGYHLFGCKSGCNMPGMPHVADGPMKNWTCRKWQLAHSNCVTVSLHHNAMLIQNFRIPHMFIHPSCLFARSSCMVNQYLFSTPFTAGAPKSSSSRCCNRPRFQLRAVPAQFLSCCSKYLIAAAIFWLVAWRVLRSA